MATTPDIAGFDAGLPANIDAEKTILGAILLDNESFFDDSAVIEAEDFSLDSHRIIYRAMTNILFGMVEGSKAVDIITLAHELNRINSIGAVGGVAYLASLTEGLPRRPVIGEYVRIVKDKAMLRRVMVLCSTAIARAESQNETALQIVNALETQLAEVTDSGVVTSAVSIGSVTKAIEDSVMKAREISSEKTALEMTWGLEEWDKATKGCYRGEFSILSGESGGGKTALMIQTAIANALEGTPVLIFSLEMSKEAFVRRFYAAISSALTASQMRDPRLMNLHTHVPAMRDVSRQLASLPIEIDDTSPLRIDTLKKRLKMWRRKWRQQDPSKTKFLCEIDYLQLIKGMPKLIGIEKTENIVFTLRDLPNKEEKDVHVLALSQYSQGDKFRKTKTRTKDSLFGGAMLHQAAQNVFMLRIEPQGDKPDNALLDTEIKIEKQREGKVSVVKTYFNGDHLKYGTPQQMLKG
jgi:replicative DNA helicase